MDHSSGDLMKALVAKLYSIVTGDDDKVIIPRNKFVTWFLPGLPFTPNDFRFVSKGFAGATAEEVSEAYHQAFVVSSLFDYVPDVSSGFLSEHMQQAIFAGTQDRISTVYNDVLKYSRVVHKELSDAEKAKLQKFRDLLTVEVEEVDILTDEKRTVSKPGKLTLAYLDKMEDYITAADQLVNLKIDALAATGPEPEAKARVFRYNEGLKFLEHRLNAAEMAWTSQGYRYEYDQINAYIEQVTQKSLVLYKQDLQRKLANAQLASAADGGSKFFYTTLLPGNFATSSGWTRFTFQEIDYSTHHQGKTNSWGASAGVNFGLWSVGGSASGGKTETSDDSSANGFEASFEFTQVPICRPWFEPGFFSMRSWTLDDIWNLSYDNKPVSDGEAKPSGRLVAYPVSALFIRNVKIKSSAMEQHADFMSKHAGGGGSVSYGPIRVGGNYSSGSTTRNSSYSLKGETLTIDGMQLIGTINNLIPKSPDTNPDLKPADFVGGAE